MVVLKLNNPEVAYDVAHTLRGKQFGQYVLVPRHDAAAIDLAIALSGGSLVKNRRPTIALAMLALSLIAFQGVIGVWFWTKLTAKADAEINRSIKN